MFFFNLLNNFQTYIKINISIRSYENNFFIYFTIKTLNIDFNLIKKLVSTV